MEHLGPREDHGLTFQAVRTKALNGEERRNPLLSILIGASGSEFVDE